MREEIYFHLLILCGIWSQGIIETFADEFKESSDIDLVRQKRVINNVSSENSIALISDASYIVNIRRRNRIHCVGSILSHHVVLTISACVTLGPLEYKVMSSNSRSDRGNNHDVIDIKRQNGGHPSRPGDGIALLTVDPSFVFGLHDSNIKLNSEPLLPGEIGIISGWGYNCGTTSYSKNLIRLRYIKVPIISHQECKNRYQPHRIEISEKDVCTYHPQKYCGHTDGGAPLVVNGRLAGVRLWTGPEKGQINTQYPDVFAMVQHSVYREWISRTTYNIEEEFQSYHNK